MYEKQVQKRVTKARQHHSLWEKRGRGGREVARYLKSDHIHLIHHSHEFNYFESSILLFYVASVFLQDCFQDTTTGANKKTI